MTSSQAELNQQAGWEMEYQALRTEIVERIGIRNQIMLATLTLAGIMLSFGVTNPSIAFVFPIIATFLAAAWPQSAADPRASASRRNAGAASPRCRRKWSGTA
jgi:hypothetical protein